MSYQSDEVMVEGHLEEAFGALEQDSMELVCIHTACPWRDSWWPLG